MQYLEKGCFANISGLLKVPLGLVNKKGAFPTKRSNKTQSLSAFSLTVLALCLLFFPGCVRLNTAPDLEQNRITSEQKMRASIVKTARSHLGTKYKYGGSSPQTGFDCSGLIFWSYSQHGIAIPRTARDQMNFGTAVRKEELQPGDILAFKILRKRKIRYHTALYEGDGKFIHSPTTGKRIHEEYLNSSYWKKRFVTARRVPMIGGKKPR